MADTKPVDTTKPTPDANQKPAAGSPAVVTDDLKAFSQKLEGLENEVKTSKQKITDLSTENATLRASFNDIQVTADDDDSVTETEPIPEAEAQRIGELMRDDPEKGARELVNLNQRVVQDTLKQAERQRAKGVKIGEDVRKFVEGIYTEKPHLRQYDNLLGAMATAKQNQTGKTFDSILQAVKEFEETYLSKIPAEKKPEAAVNPADVTSPAGAQGETGSPTAPAEPEPEEPDDETVAQAIARREKERQSKVSRGTR